MIINQFMILIVISVTLEKNMKTKIFNNHLNLKIEIAPDVLDIWANHRQLDKKSTEACGVILGSFSEIENTLFIQSCTTPGLQDIRTRYSFKMSDQKHQKAIDNSFEESNSKIFYLGTWHTHPEAFPTPSSQDLREWSKIQTTNKDRIPIFLFAIIGFEQISLYPFENKDYHKI